MSIEQQYQALRRRYGYEQAFRRLVSRTWLLLVLNSWGGHGH